MLSDVTCLIPLYRSVPQLGYVFANIDSHIAAGGRVLCSDEHLLDDAAQRIVARYEGTDLVRVLRTDAGGNWVSNCNRLIAACETPFFRILPHDDSVVADATARLVQVLRDEPGTVLSHGRVVAETGDGTRLPQRDEPKLPLRPSDAPYAFSAGLFWQGLFNGAFKAVMRRNVIDGQPLMIRPTPSLRHSERAWVFAYSLLGDFAFTPEAGMTKRYWKGSLTDGWKAAVNDPIDTATVMASYVDDLLEDGAVAQALRRNLYLNAVRHANWRDGLVASRPAFEPPVIPAP